MTKFRKILLTGIHGQVGNALHPRLQQLGQVIALDRKQLDLTDINAIRQAVRDIKPDLIINPAAYTAVDKAESEPALAHAINGIAPGIFAEEAARLGALLVHYSTDYVFDGNKSSPYLETDVPHPVSVYGASKLAGEQAIQASNAHHLILRTSWVYSTHGKNFLLTILRLAAQQDTLRIVADQFGAPTSSNTIADTTIAILQQWDPQHNGIYHLVNSGETNWHGFAREIILQYVQLQKQRHWQALKVQPEHVIGITTAEYPTPAHRPTNSRMLNKKIEQLTGLELPHWQTALVDTLKQL
ncbi:dTDP-4-dehydrorhamnose reductase [Methylobacillus rhizosphaerae]|uniref:dTDP-4-dehydrorhamnose reductase n=1 Tax=Methylobacillus rhizosphaerae TaxID=551994 RepID=A0A239AM58_9PROT|nr:dTDP-4-dehydrorhamnose reductase [Methylobacillus rhizosphaerae]SNR96590.1 dTDP-4-dehydrorhamnose reductase [Methylobacillus rhizosphaerae]